MMVFHFGGAGRARMNELEIGASGCGHSPSVSVGHGEKWNIRTSLCPGTPFDFGLRKIPHSLAMETVGLMQTSPFIC